MLEQKSVKAFEDTLRVLRRHNDIGVVGVLACYEPDTEFHTYLLLPDEHIDGMVGAAAWWVLDVDDEGKDSLHGLDETLADLPVNVFIFQTSGDFAQSDFVYWHRAATTIPLNHARLDILREITTKWSNAVHKAQLVWHEAEPVEV